MAVLEISVVDEIDQLSRRLLRNLECCDRVLVGQQRLTASQAYTLQTLDEFGQSTMNRLASSMRLHGTTMTRMIDALVEKNFVERLDHPADRRVVLVKLSPPGRSAVEDLRRRKREFLGASLKELPAEEVQTILAGLRRLADLAEDWGDRICP